MQGLGTSAQFRESGSELYHALEIIASILTFQKHYSKAVFLKMSSLNTQNSSQKENSQAPPDLQRYYTGFSVGRPRNLHFQ